MEVLYLIRLFWGWGVPYIGLTYYLHLGEYLHFGARKTTDLLVPAITVLFLEVDLHFLDQEL